MTLAAMADPEVARKALQCLSLPARAPPVRLKAEKISNLNKLAKRPSVVDHPQRRVREYDLRSTGGADGGILLQPLMFSVCIAGVISALLCVSCLRPEWICRVPKSVLGVTAAITVIAMAALVSLSPVGLRLRLDPSSEPLLPAGDPAQDTYRSAVLEFGDDEIYVIAVEADRIFDYENLLALRRTTDRIAHMDGVRSVKSLVDVTAFRFDVENNWIDIGPFIEDIPTDPVKLAELRDHAISDPLFVRTIISPDARVAAINISFHKMSDREFIEGRFDERISGIIAQEERDGRRFYVAGRPHVKSRVYALMLRDLQQLIPIAIGVVALVLYLLFGSLRMVVLPLGVVLLATLWTFAAIAWLELPLTVLTVLLAPVLIAIGSAYGVHLLSRHAEEVRDGLRGTEAVVACLHAMRSPVMISGLTTAIGFAALCISDVPAVFELGALSVFGVGCLTLLTLTALPATLLVLPSIADRPPKSSALTAALQHPLEAALRGLGNLTTRHASAVLVAWGSVSVAAAIAIPGIVVDTDYLSFFDPRSKVRTDFEAVNRLLSGAVPIYVVFSDIGVGAFREPANLRALERLQARFDAIPGVSRTTSMVDFIRVLHRVVAGDDPAYERIPDSRAGVAEVIHLIPKGDLSRVSNVNQSRANIIIRTGEIGSAAIGTLVEKVGQVIDEVGIPPGMDFEITGNTVLLSRSADGIASGQPRTVGVAAVAIFVLVAGSLRSLRFGWIAMLPNIVPVLLFFGLLGAGAAPLSVPTSLIASVALGIAIDATAHYLVRYRAERLAGASPEEAVHRCNQSAGRPIFIAAATLLFGFAVVSLSGFASLREFGVLSAVTMAICLANDLILLPALLIKARL